tara:strand:- start:863 stop:1348 length:486 start_codon:yes stop_codon:yes gene_type:complete
MKIITKKAWIDNNLTMASSGSTLKAMAIENGMYNYNQVLKGAYGSFGETDIAMQDEKSIVQKYGSAIKLEAQRVGVTFDKETYKTSKNKKKSKNLVMPTLEEFEAILIAALAPKDKVKKDYDFVKALEQFVKKASDEGYSEASDAILDAVAALATEQAIAA